MWSNNLSLSDLAASHLATATKRIDVYQSDEVTVESPFSNSKKDESITFPEFQSFLESDEMKFDDLDSDEIKFDDLNMNEKEDSPLQKNLSVSSFGLVISGQLENGSEKHVNVKQCSRVCSMFKYKTQYKQKQHYATNYLLTAHKNRDSSVTRFDFATPSPDDRIIQSQKAVV